MGSEFVVIIVTPTLLNTYDPLILNSRFLKFGLPKTEFQLNNIQSSLAIMNNNGTFRYIKQLAKNAYHFKMQPNGNYTYYDYNDEIFYETDKKFNIEVQS